MTAKNEMTNRLPANPDAERALLGALLIDPERMDEVADLLQPTDFYRQANGWIYSVMHDLWERNQPIDFVTVQDGLKGKLAEIGGPGYITELLADSPTGFYATEYAGIVHRTGTNRKLIAAAGKIAQLAYDDPEADSVTVQAEQLIAAVTAGTAKTGMHHLGSTLNARLDQLEQRATRRSEGYMTGIPTGYGQLDMLLGGLQLGDMSITAGRPGMGKSAWALDMCLNAAAVGVRVAYFSPEMSEEQLIWRVLARQTGIDSNRIRIGQILDNEWDIILAASDELSKLPVHLDDSPGITPTELRAKARRLHAEHGLDLVVVDYMQLMQSGHARMEFDRTREISYISRQLALLARELNIHVNALSQLNRGCEQRADKRPLLSDLKESGSLEQDAAVVFMIYRDDYYNEDSDRQNITDVLVRKHRHGATGNIPLWFNKGAQRFRDLERMELD